MRKTGKLICILLAACFVLGGCGYKDVWENRIDVRRNGQVRAVYADSFSDETYNFTYFEEEVLDAVEAYNESAGENRITVKDVTLNEETARVILYYKDAEDAALFNKQVFFSGPAADAAAEAADGEDTKLVSPDGSEKTTLGAVPKDNSRIRAIVLAEDTSLSVPGNVLYISENCTVTEDGRIAINAHEEEDTLPKPAVIIYRS